MVIIMIIMVILMVIITVIMVIIMVERERESLFFPYTLVIQLFFKYGNERKFINKGGFFDKNRLEMFDSNYGSPIMVV